MTSRAFSMLSSTLCPSSKQSPQKKEACSLKLCPECKNIWVHKSWWKVILFAVVHWVDVHHITYHMTAMSSDNHITWQPHYLTTMSLDWVSLRLYDLTTVLPDKRTMWYTIWPAKCITQQLYFLITIWYTPFDLTSIWPDTVKRGIPSWAAY